jgi:hypothetical protein
MFKRAFKRTIGGQLYLLNTITAFFACGTAEFVNTVFMRGPEMKKGIDVLHPETK